MKKLKSEIVNIGNVNIPVREDKDIFTRSKYVTEITPEYFDERKTHKLKSSGRSLVLFYAPWCGHCKHFKPEWMNFARSLHENGINFYAFNCEKYKEHVMKMNIDGKDVISSYPTIIYYEGSKSLKKFQGERTKDNLVKFLKT